MQPEPAPSRRRSRRSETVLAALRDFARGEIVCELPSTIARSLGVSTDTVYRGINDLLSDGRLERTPLQPRGKATAYRLVESPQADVGPPQKSAAIQTAAARPPKGAAAAQSEDRSQTPDLFEAGPSETPQRRWSQSPMSRADRDHLDNFEWTPELLDDYAARATKLVLRFSRADEVPVSEVVERGPCGDCGKDALRRRLGDFALCNSCRGRRLAAGVRLASEQTAAERFRVPTDRDNLRPIETPRRVRWVAA
jgi:hypothetical protein